ncbi:MAG: DoxX family protein [Terriglobales bacterium]|jgi:hypothetical protein
MQATQGGGPLSKPSLWPGGILSALVVALLILDGVTKILALPQVVDAFVRLGYPVGLARVIGTVLLVCVAVYAVPSTSTLGAILLTGYLGGATEVNLRAGNPLFQIPFPVLFGMLVWLGLFLRDRQLRALVPLRRTRTITQV